MALKRIVVRPRCGLGNRLIGLASAIELASELSADLAVDWRPDEQCDAEIEQLLQYVGIWPFELTRDEASDQLWKDARNRSVEEMRKELNSKEVLRLHVSCSFGSGVTPNGLPSDAAKSHLRKLLPSQHIAEKLVQFPNFEFGIHIRSTDHIPSQICSPEWVYGTALEKLHAMFPRSRILICSDSPEKLERLRAKLGKELIFHSPTADRPSTKDGQQPLAVQGMLELHLLAKCNVIIGSPLSTFSDVASYYGTSSKINLTGYLFGVLSQKATLNLANRSWRLYRWVRFDRTTQLWRRWERKRSCFDATLSFVALSLVSIICNRTYQQLCGIGLGRFRLRRNLSRLLSDVREP